MKRIDFTAVVLAVAYITGIVAVNIGFNSLPIVNTLVGALPTMAFFVGFIFIFRDLAQRRLGHIKVIPLMLVGVIITWFTVDEALALASVCAFIISETVDWFVYTYTGRKFEDRVLISTALASPVDTAVFLGMIGMLSVGSVVVMSLSKMFFSLVLWCLWRKYNVDKHVTRLIGA